MKSVILKPGREKSVLRKHPWIFSGAVAQVEGKPSAGETVLVTADDRKPLALGSYSPESQIVVRIWTWNPEEVIGLDFFRKKVVTAVRFRESIGMTGPIDACRMIFSESDGLPGLVTDRYGDYLVCQFSSAGADSWKKELVLALSEILPCKGIFERSDLDIRHKEGMSESTGILWGEVPPETIRISEEGRIFEVNLREGHKTGHYLDQRENHSLVQKNASGRTVLDCFSYTGGFAIAALTGQASHVTLVDSSAPALARAAGNTRLNGFSDSVFDTTEADVFRFLRTAKDQNKTYDLIILDPPKFVESKSQLEKGARAYKDINRLAAMLLNPGGILFTFSCSGHMEEALFQKIVADAALDARRDLRILRWLSQSPDHPVSAAFPEGKYLKGLMAAVV